MKQLEASMTITYRWWRDDGKNITHGHAEALKETAEERIGEMMKQGCVSGELCDNIHMTDKDPEDGVEYTGWWEVKQD